jgi:hypothetical protein
VILSFLYRWRLFDVALCPWKYIDRQEMNGTVACGFSVSDSHTFTTYQRLLWNSSHVATSFSALCGTEGTLTIFTRVHHWPVSWARWIQLHPLLFLLSTPSHSVLLNIHFSSRSTNCEKRRLASSCRVEQLGSHWMEFHEIWYLNIFRKSDE